MLTVVQTWSVKELRIGRGDDSGGGRAVYGKIVPALNLGDPSSFFFHLQDLS